MSPDEYGIVLPDRNQQGSQASIPETLIHFIGALNSSNKSISALMTPGSDLETQTMLFSRRILYPLLDLSPGTNRVVGWSLHQDQRQTLVVLNFAREGHSATISLTTSPTGRLTVSEILPLDPFDPQSKLSPEAKIFFKAQPPPVVVCRQKKARPFLQQLADNCSPSDLFELTHILKRGLHFWENLDREGYLITDCVGWRPFNIVARAVQKETGRVKAVKWLKETAIDLQEKFHREIELLKVVSPLPSFPVLRLDGEVLNSPFHLCDWVPGQTLYHLRPKWKLWKVSDKKTILKRVAQALVNLHKRGIVHRDVAPDHIFVEKNLSVHLVDFGMSEWMGQQDPIKLEGYIQNDLGNFGLTACELLFENVRFQFGNPAVLKQQWQEWSQRLKESSYDASIKSVIAKAVQANREIATTCHDREPPFKNAQEILGNIKKW